MKTMKKNLNATLKQAFVYKKTARFIHTETTINEFLSSKNQCVVTISFVMMQVKSCPNIYNFSEHVITIDMTPSNITNQMFLSIMTSITHNRLLAKLLIYCLQIDKGMSKATIFLADNNNSFYNILFFFLSSFFKNLWMNMDIFTSCIPEGGNLFISLISLMWWIWQFLGIIKFCKKILSKLRH